jgi:hypothetical protein
VMVLPRQHWSWHDVVTEVTWLWCDALPRDAGDSVAESYW